MYGFYLAIGMGYGILGSMGYGFEFPAYQLGGSKILWVMGEYGLSELWVMRESTVSIDTSNGSSQTDKGK
ncbi:hypothetical protein L208DRAFT_1400623 [Tricholoma matsutake]|nr:hypothetical protein L208DRAFT_1400623 [Tricholoma matsutake 945]